jgi:hypothetical protein
MTLQKLILGITVFLWAAVAALTATAFYAVVLDQPYLSYPTNPMPTVGDTFKAGDVVPITIVRCNNSGQAKALVGSKALVNVTHPAAVEPVLILINAEPGCTTPFVSTNNRLPDDLAPGIYRYVGNVPVNGFLRTFEVQWQTQEFEVTP